MTAAVMIMGALLYTLSSWHRCRTCVGEDQQHGQTGMQCCSGNNDVLL
jgi:hypothetical protein